MKIDKSRIKPVGHRLLIKLEEVEETYGETKILVARDAVNMAQHAQVVGEVLAIGDQAFIDLGGREVQTKDGNTTVITKDGKPWCKVGDKVLVEKYKFMQIPDEDLKDYKSDIVLVNDQNVTAIVEEA